MELTFHSTQGVGEIVAAFPGASNLFKAHGIDFCCGGGRALREVLAEKGIAEDSFLAQLHHLYEEARRRADFAGTDWREVPLHTLVEHIVSTHHAYLKQELPLLSEFVSKIDRVHGDRHPELATLNRLFHELKKEMEAHLVAEENESFPLVTAYEKSGTQEDLVQAVETFDRLEREHVAVGQLLASMREATGGYHLPADACRTYTVSFHKLVDLESDTFQHIHLENNILFPRLRRALEVKR